MATINLGAASTKVHQTGKNPQWELGTRPPGLRNSPMQRVKPAPGSTRSYGKLGQMPPMKSGFGNTGITGLS